MLLSLVLIPVLAVLMPTPLPRELSAVYPGPTVTIEGWNYSTSPPSYSALHFTNHAAWGWWEQSNSADGCHFDAFEWHQTLDYLSTHDQCGTVVQDTLFNPPIHLMPKLWDGVRWTLTGASTETDYADGVVRCRGLDSWRSDVNGLEEITPGEWAVHVSSVQHTDWEYGPCAGQHTDWTEDYYFTDHLRRSVGRNANGAFSWDVWFD